LPPRRIAALDDVPVKTVKTRLARALAQLRAGLDSEFGERGAWLAVFQPWLRAAHVPTILGVTLMSLKLKSTLAAAAILCALLVGWRLRSTSRAQTSDASSGETAQLVAPGAAPVDAPRSDSAASTTSREAVAPAAADVEP